MNRISKINPNFRLSSCLILFAITLAALGMPSPAQAKDPLVLREQVSIFGKLVTLGDLFENAGEEAGVAVFRAPELGTSGIVAAKRVAAAAKQHGHTWKNPGEITEVVVRRPGRLITLNEMRDAIADRVGNGDGEWSVNLSRGTRPFHIDTRIKSAITIKQFDIGRSSGAFRAVIAFENAPVPVRDKIVTGRAFPSINVVVPTRVIERGGTITQDDMQIIAMPRSQVPRTAIDEMETAIGMAARQRLILGRPIRREHLEHPKLVKRNTLVTITYAVPGMVLRTKGRAMADAAKGQAVQVVNMQSKRTIEAEVTGTAAVAVRSLGPALPVNQALAANQSQRQTGSGANIVR